MSPDTKALRRYQAGVERALGLFDATNEWADYIAFLSRLIKSLQGAPPGADVPSKNLLAKYLAQCLRPSLPAGVHQKALEVYDVVFSLLGKDGLSKDLSLYLPGISHTLSFASLSTRPWFLSLYDEHILKLSPSTLRPALKAIILSLLPGIEEENSEDFERTLNTLNRLRAAFSGDQVEDVFWQSLFLASVTSPNRRMGVLMYLVRYLPKLHQPKSAFETAAQLSEGTQVSYQTITTPEPGLLIRCFATGLQDEQPLVQRGFLDLLVTHVPLQAPTLQQEGSANDLDILVSAAMSIVLRRDMSLNRRLWSWFLGQVEGSNHETTVPHSSQNGSLSPKERESESTELQAYFSTYGLASIIRTFEKMLSRKPSIAIHRARPFRILVSLMDRATIGQPVVDAIFESMVQDLRLYQSNAPTQSAFDEVFRSASVFFESIEPRVIAYNIIKLYEKGNLDLIEFIALNFNLEDSDMSAKHTALIAVTLSDELGIDQERSKPRKRGAQEQVARTMSLLLPIAPAPSIDESVGNSETIGPASLTAIDSHSIRAYYEKSMAAQSNVTPIRPELVLSKLYGNVFHAIATALQDPSRVGLLESLTSIVDKLFNNFSKPPLSLLTLLTDALAQWAADADNLSHLPFTMSKSVSILTASLLAMYRGDSLTTSSIVNVIEQLISSFWVRLGPSTPQYHVECVDAIWTLRSLSANLYLVDSTILSLLSRCQSDVTEADRQRILKFGTIWTHTKLPGNSTPALSGHVSDSAADPLVFLRAAILYIIDATAADTASDPYRIWISNISSLSMHFQAVLEGIRPQKDEEQATMTNLIRLLKLLKIAKTSPLLWKEFLGSQGAALPVLEQTTSIILSESIQGEEAQICLEIIRLLHEGLDIPLSDSLIPDLVVQVAKRANGSKLQERLLETLQLLVALEGSSPPPMELLPMTMESISSPSTDMNLERWITLLCNAIPNYSDPVLFANLLKLTDCFCNRMKSSFQVLQSLYEDDGSSAQHLDSITPPVTSPERSITNLLSGLEFILARAHTKIVETGRPPSGTREHAADVSQSRARANNRLTAVLCMQDAIRVCGQLWFWRPSRKLDSAGSVSKSFTYMSLRLRSRSRRMLEHLIQAEPQECLETLMGLWVEAVKTRTSHGFVMNLLESLDGARPKFMMPAIFNAIYGRTNPSALDAEQRSSLSVDLSALQLVAFLTDYVEALEDDLLEEIWSDCTSFLRDILANPMPHRQILLRLLGFLAVLCKKMENTNFGDQFRMRRELAESCARLFTAIFTIKPGGFDQSTGILREPGKEARSIVERFQSKHGIEIMCQALPAMTSVMSEADRTATIYTGISTNITGPLLRARAFPTTIGSDVLELLLIMSKAQQASKIWKKEVSDAFNDTRFFQSSPELAQSGWLPIVSQLATLDKTLMGDLLSRLTAPATAGIMFGVGATSARIEADKQAKGNLRRIAMLLLANDNDQFLPVLNQITTKAEELFTATATSSPSSGIKGDLLLLLRAVTCSFSQNNLAGLWPVIDSELRVVFEDISKKSDAILTPYSLMQAAKLLDLLLLVKPEEFQLHEWLYVTDTIDAIYPPASWRPVAMADSVVLDAAHPVELQSLTAEGIRKPWLSTDLSRSADSYLSLLNSFFGNLSIRAFEDTYSLDPVDYQACKRDVLTDLFTQEDCNEGK